MIQSFERQRRRRTPRGRVSELLLIGGTVCSVLLWSIYASMISTPGVLDRAGSVKGWDFPQFYAIGRLGLTNHRDDLSSGEAIRNTVLDAVSPTMRTSVFVPVYGPQVALLFSPFARLAYLDALACWLGLSLIIYTASCVSLWRWCRSLRSEASTVALLAAGSPVLFFVVCYGQLSAVALGLFTVAFFALEREHPLLAGLALGSLVYKPQLGLAPGLILLAAGEWRIVAAAIASAAAQVAIALSYAGSAVLRAYLHTLMHLNEHLVLVQQKTHLLQSLSSFFELLLPWPRVALAASVVAALVVLAVAWRVWTSGAPLALRYSTLLLATVLVSPHFYVYDLMILVPAGFLLVDWLLRSPATPGGRAIAASLALLYVVPLAGAALASISHLQVTTLLLCAMTGLVARSALVNRLHDPASAP